MKEAELFYGRLGMLAITGFAVQEFFLHSAVVNQMPFELMREIFCKQEENVKEHRGRLYSCIFWFLGLCV